MWVMDHLFKYSNFGAVSWMHDDFFILAVSTNGPYSFIPNTKYSRIFRGKKIVKSLCYIWFTIFKTYLWKSQENTSFYFRKEAFYGNENLSVTSMLLIPFHYDAILTFFVECCLGLQQKIIYPCWNMSRFLGPEP